MPREGVPYPSREICSLKCQIDALQRQINELMKSINGVEGDGQGNVSLISGDPAIVINNDAVQNQIEIALDSSQLPAAAISSVNGQTGVVDLDGADIPLNPGQSTPTVQNAVAANAGNISQLQTDLNQEVLDRGNADSALQANINALQASIPGEAAQAVANDPTVQQLAVDVPNKLDKITSGSALKAYTHTGANQGETSVIDGTAADSLAIRDANGRIQAADPASGATDKTLVTSNWVSQTGDSAPNNLLHRSGSESKTGTLTLLSQVKLPCIFDNKQSQNIETTSTWRRVYHNNVTPANQMLVLLVTPQKPAISGNEYGILMVGGTANNNPICKWMLKGSGITVGNFVATYNTVNGFELWVKNISGNQGLSFIRLNETNWGSGANNWTADQSTVNASFDYTTYPFYTVSS